MGKRQALNTVLNNIQKNDTPSNYMNPTAPRDYAFSFELYASPDT